jgi:hypothetical protein
LDLAQAARFQLGIAVRQCQSIGFACPSQYDIHEVADIVKNEFPTMVELIEPQNQWKLEK